METTIIQRYIHTSPRKLRLVADMVRMSTPDKALEILKFTRNYASTDLKKAVESAIASGKQKGMEKINFKSVEINEGPRLKRMRAGSRGRGKPYKRRMSHIKIVLTDGKEGK
ncbi:MAG: 50S ribosomal protein L22 [Microgenomates group bacterium Gr01-1014_93]|nr:MAG: 50S ribosomal protein L22 [Microgenomates group bacterium Gr01-1014_93]